MNKKNIIIVIVGLMVLSTALAGAVSSGTTHKASKTTTSHMTSQMTEKQKQAQIEKEKMQEQEKKNAAKNQSKEICPENVSKNISKNISNAKVISLGTNTLLTGVNNVNDWAMVNYDLLMSRNSRQTDINAGNVKSLQVKWIFNTGYTVEDSPLIVGNRVYIQNNAMQVFALDRDTGLNVWKFDPNVILPSGQLPRASSSHGMTFDNNTIYAPTSANGTVVAINAQNGNKIWETPKLSTGTAWRISAPPVVVGNYIIVGSALGDEPPFGMPAQGMITGIDRRSGNVLWQTKTAVGAWVEGSNANVNGGATSWSGGAVDVQKGIIYLPTGNPAPDFNAFSRPEPTLYSNSVIAVNITTGQIIWNTPFIASGSILPNVVTPDTHDWDTAWGTNLVLANINGRTSKVVIGHDKRGDVMAMDAFNGQPLWHINLAVLRNETIQASDKPTQTVWPGPGYGVENYIANDGTTLYVAVSNMGTFYYSNGTVSPDFNAIWNGLGNGSINAVDIATGHIKWRVQTPYPTYCSPLVTNDLVFSGHITATGKDYPFNAFGGPTKTYVQSQGVLLAMDKSNGNILWQAQVGAPVGIGGPSIGQGLLVVPTGDIQVPNAGGYVVAYGLPNRATPDFSKQSEVIGRSLPIIPMGRFLNQSNAAKATYLYPNTPAGGSSNQSIQGIYNYPTMTTTSGTATYTNQTTPMTTYQNVTQTMTNQTTTPMTTNNSCQPTLKITSPMEGASVNNVSISVDITYFTVCAKEGKAAVPGQGHIHYYLDTMSNDTQGQPAYPMNSTAVWFHTENFTQNFTNVKPGKHFVTVELANNDHTPLNPPVTAKVNFTVGNATSMTTNMTTNMTNTSTNTTGKAVTVMLSAQNIKYNMSKITVPAGAQVTVKFNNMDSGVPHNFAVYTDSSATQSIFKGQIVTGPTTTTYTFTAPSKAGTYYFHCDVHPTVMFGDFVVQ